MLDFASVILPLSSVGLLRYLEVIEFVYCVGSEQRRSEDKKYCICLKIAQGFMFSFYMFLNRQKVIR